MKETQGTERRERPRARNKVKLVSPVDSYSPTIPFLPAEERLLNIQSGGGGICSPSPPSPSPQKNPRGHEYDLNCPGKGGGGELAPVRIPGKKCDRPSEKTFF